MLTCSAPALSLFAGWTWVVSLLFSTSDPVYVIGEGDVTPEADGDAVPQIFWVRAKRVPGRCGPTAMAAREGGVAARRCCDCSCGAGRACTWRGRWRAATRPPSLARSPSLPWLSAGRIRAAHGQRRALAGHAHHPAGRRLLLLHLHAHLHLAHHVLLLARPRRAAQLPLDQGERGTDGQGAKGPAFWSAPG